METSSQQLLIAVQTLCGIPETDNSYGNMFSAYAVASEISQQFGNVNTSLQNGWSTTADFFQKLSTTLQTRMQGLRDVMSQFSVDTIDAEMVAATASESANSAAEDILAQLESELSSTGGLSSTQVNQGSGS